MNIGQINLKDRKGVFLKPQKDFNTVVKPNAYSESGERDGDPLESNLIILLIGSACAIKGVKTGAPLGAIVGATSGAVLGAFLGGPAGSGLGAVVGGTVGALAGFSIVFKKCTGW